MSDSQPTAAVTSEPATDPNSPAEPVLVSEQLSQAYGSVSVLSDVSVSIESGTLTAVVGPNGSGKTTLLKTLAGLLSPSEGTVQYYGPDAEREIGYLPQRPSFRPQFSTLETLEFYTALVDDDPEELLARVGLRDAAERRVEALSGGMTRLLGLAQATVGDPPVVVLDEPGSGLDPTMRKRTFKVAHELATDGTAVICSSHDLALVEQWADQVIVLDGGSVVDMGSPAELCKHHNADSLWDVFDIAVEKPDNQVAVLGVDDE